MTRRGRLLVLLGVALAVVGATPASADEQPSILKTYGLDWIERVREEAWPGAKTQRPVICLLDTGVAVTPDTPADDPAGPIVARLAIDGGTGLPQGNERLHAHGTQMAAVMAAPRNDWGTVGVFPQARIVSIRVTEGDETHITPEGMVLGVNGCLDWAWEQSARVATVVMAESNYDQRETDVPRWLTAGEGVAAVGGAFLAAAGNRVGAGPVVPPLGIDQVISVGAGNSARGHCAFTPVGQIPGLWAPGCDAAGWPSGTSTATAVAGAVVAAGVTRAGALPAAELVADFLQSDRVLDGTAVRNTYFQGLVDEAAPSGAGGLVSDTQIVRDAPSESTRVLRLWRPQARASWRSGRLTVQVASGVPPSGRVLVRIGGRKFAGPAGTRRFSIKRSRRPRRIELWVEGERPSPWRSLLVRTRLSQS